MAAFTLYGHHRSSASYRARIALNLKGVQYETVFIDLLKGDQRREEFQKLNPEGLVPVLAVDGQLVSQSLAIIEYLEETIAEPALLPEDPVARARVRAFALAVACDIHPLNNLRVLAYLTGPLGLSTATKDQWYQHWIAEGLSSLETLVNARGTPSFCFGEAPNLADVLLIPQLANARRTHCDLTPYPSLLRIEKNCMALSAFQKAAPENQPQA